jgi:exopolyphosphatase/guanosine-5'-triphosphate,3'-diphosphate pyrophosphatase
MQPVNIAIADLGSNSLKLSVTRVGAKGEQRILHAAAITVRLGYNVAKTGAMDPARIERAVEALRNYESIARNLGATIFIGVATAAVRMAANGNEFLSRVANETAWDITVISGDEEAHLAFLGLQAELPGTGAQVILDIGGASTEIIQVVDGAVTASQSIQLGSGTLADRCLETDPPGIPAVRSARAHADEVFAAEARPVVRGASLYVSGGNGVFLSQVADWDVVRLPFVVPFFPLLVDRLAEIPSDQVASHLAITGERARMLPAGAAIVWSLVDLVQPVDMLAIQSGIRGGLIRRWIAGHDTISSS